eukprot:110050-Pleurochrysis_carterae.AAC.3
MSALGRPSARIRMSGAEFARSKAICAPEGSWMRAQKAQFQRVERAVSGCREQERNVRALPGDASSTPSSTSSSKTVKVEWPEAENGQT